MNNDNDNDNDNELVLNLLGDVNYNLYKSCIAVISTEQYKRLQHDLFVFRDIPLTRIQQRNFIIIALSNAQIEERNTMKPTETKELLPMELSMEELIARYVSDCVAQEKKHNYGQQETFCYYDEKAKDVLLDFLIWEKDRAAWLVIYEK